MKETIDGAFLSYLITLCKDNNIRRLKYKTVEVEFGDIEPNQVNYPMNLKNALVDPDMVMPEDMLGWSSPLEIMQDPKAKSHIEEK